MEPSGDSHLPFASFGNFILHKPTHLWAEMAQRKYGLNDKCWSAMVLPFFSNINGYIIDIGANIGDTAAIIRSHLSNPIVCFEGDNKFLPYLSMNSEIIGGVEIKDKYFDPSGEIAANIIETRGNPLFIKTDTDGLDMDIINTFLNTGSHTFYFEYDPVLTKKRTGKDSTTETLERLRCLGYSFIFFSNWGPPFYIFDAGQTSATDMVLRLNQKLKRYPDVCFFDVWSFAPQHTEVYESAKAFIHKHYAYFVD